ncbi:MAG TPA: glycosyltransferase family 2 protein [Patescibacteria group bacterium]
MHLVIVIPAYNESRVIGDVIASLPKTLPGIRRITPLVIDDNSSDETRLCARKAGALCISHGANLGAGGATITGFEAAMLLKADIVVTMDGDGQHDPEDLPNLINPIIQKKADVVFGSRLLNNMGNMPLYKKFGNNLMNIITYIFYRIWISDSQSGYKAFSKYALRRIRLSTSGYEFCSEICGQIKQKKLHFIEVPIKTIYTDYSRAKGQLALNAVNIVVGLLLSKIR